MNQCVQETTNDYLHLKANFQDLDTWFIFQLLETLDFLAV